MAASRQRTEVLMCGVEKRKAKCQEYSFMLCSTRSGPACEAHFWQKPQVRPKSMADQSCLLTSRSRVRLRR